MLKNLSDFYYNKGLQLAKDKSLGSAVQNLGKAVSYNGGNIEAWNLVGLCYYRLGMYKKAEYCWMFSVNKGSEGNRASDYLIDLRNCLEETAPYFSQVDTLWRQKKYQQAARVLSEEICSRFDASAGLLNLLGILLLLDGRVTGAVDCWTKVLSLDRSNIDAARYLKEVESGLRYRLLAWKEGLFRRKDIIKI